MTPNNHGAAARQPHQVRARHHAQGQGAEGDLDRLPLLTWIMFLKFLDDMERVHEDEAVLAGEPFQLADRAAVPLARLGGRSGGHHRADLLAFINRRAVRGRTARRARACSLTCERLRGNGAGRHRRDVIADGVSWRRKPHEQRLPAARRHQQGQRHPLHITEEHPHARPLYESMLREMRDAAGRLGEFYTPRRSCASWSR